MRFRRKMWSHDDEFPAGVPWAASSVAGRRSPPAGVHVAGASASSTTSPGSSRRCPPTGRAPPAASLDLLDLDSAVIPRRYDAPIPLWPTEPPILPTTGRIVAGGVIAISRSLWQRSRKPKAAE
jgi:hypothetical protein